MSQPVGTGGDTAPRPGLLLSFAGARSGVALLPFQPPGVMSFSQLLLGSEGLSKILSPGGHFLWPCLWLQHPPPLLAAGSVLPGSAPLPSFLSTMHLHNVPEGSLSLPWPS